ncbi:MAG: aldehyde dehydrogenase family protein [Verrucomicrobiales bacterium]
MLQPQLSPRSGRRHHSFNFPAMVPLWMFLIAIATGNTFLLKPSEQVPLTRSAWGSYSSRPVCRNRSSKWCRVTVGPSRPCSIIRGSPRRLCRLH